MDTIGELLRTKRARVQPGDVGLAEIGRRKVPGLRREEVAALAGIPVEQYVRLEQGKAVGVSDEALDTIGEVLRLNETERTFVRMQARSTRTYLTRRPQRVRPSVRRMLDALVDAPAYVIGRRMNVLAWNAVGNALMGFTSVSDGHRNIPWLTMARNPPARRRDHAAAVAESVAHLRAELARHPTDPLLASRISALQTLEPFRKAWERAEVAPRPYGEMLFDHPIAGDLDLTYETAALPGDEEQFLVVLTAEPGSPTEERLRLLASWAAVRSVDAEQ